MARSGCEIRWLHSLLKERHMKLLRYGTQGIEKPGMMAADGTIRDLSGHIEDLTGA